MNPKTLLDQRGIAPKKSLGQNFLHDPNALEKIVSTAELTPRDTVLEIGPGTGALTHVLADTGARVISVEIDERMRPILEAEFRDKPNVSFVFADILEVDIGQIIDADAGEFVVVANVPYYITSQIIRHLLESPRRARRIVLTVQLELAERVAAKPGDMSLLAVSVQFYGRASVPVKLNRAVFWPRPDVDSAVLCIDTYPDSPFNVSDRAQFFKVARAGFGQKRKQLKNALTSGLALKSDQIVALLNTAGIDEKRRAETLTLEEWAALTRAYAAVVG